MKNQKNPTTLKTALITGITGQDGSYLARLLLSKGYSVHGIIRRTSLINNIDRIRDIFQDPHENNIRLNLHYGDLSDTSNIIRIINEVKPDEIYNLAAMSHVKVSFETPEYCADIDGIGTLRILEAVRILKMTKKVKIYNATTSELYGKVQEVPQTEKTPFYPRSPYGVAKLYSFWISKNYREAYGMFISNGILFNHTSPQRGETFICRKTTMAVAKISLGLQETLYVGNLDAKRDFGHAADYVEAMWLMLQKDKPDDYVIATGQTISVRDFIKKSFAAAGIEIGFYESGVKEFAIVESTENDLVKIWQSVVKVDPNYFRPSEVDLLLGDASKAKKELGWNPRYNIDEIITEMVQSDIKLFQKNSL